MEITLRRNGCEYTATIDGHVFDLADLSKHQRETVTQMITEAWAKEHGFNRPKSKNRRRSRRRRNRRAA